jgi:carbon monoxide dehydrogenase subunit G
MTATMTAQTVTAPSIAPTAARSASQIAQKLAGAYPAEVLETLLRGDILLNAQTHNQGRGGAASATMYLPLDRAEVWSQITNYSRWTEFFPDITSSEVIIALSADRKRLSQTACKRFFMLHVTVDIQLNAIETADREVRFQMVGSNGGFQDFAATLTLADCHSGTALTYAVQATPKIPVPSALIQEAMKLDLPMNMRNMRAVLVAG